MKVDAVSAMRDVRPRTNCAFAADAEKAIEIEPLAEWLNRGFARAPRLGSRDRSTGDA